MISISSPLTGEAISTVTLSVSSSSKGSSLATCCPAVLLQRSTTALVPSWLVGATTSCTSDMALNRAQVGELLGDERPRRQHSFQQQRGVGTRHIRHGEPLDGCVQVEERFLRQHGRNFRAES